MRMFFAFCIFAVFEAVAFAAPAYVAGGASSGTDANARTTASFDSTGATFVAVAMNYNPTSGTPAITDSKSNTYTLLTVEPNATNNSCARIAYCESPTVGSSHTVTITLSGSYPQVIAMAYSGVGVYDQESAGGDGVSSPIQPGSLTPSEDNCLLFVGWTHETDTTANAINSSFTGLTKIAKDSFNRELVAAYKIQTSAGAENPEISWTTAAWSSAAMASFKSAASGSAVPIIQQLYRK